MKKFLRFLYIFVLLILVILCAIKPPAVETNILKAIIPSETELVDLSGKYSSKVNVLIESDDIENVYAATDLFNQEVDKSDIKSVSADVNKILEVYKKHRGGLLSKNYETLLLSGKFDEVKNQSLQKLYNPLQILVLSPQEDPFFLLTDFLENLGGTSDIITFNDKYYKILNYEFDDNIALSPSQLNKKVEKMVNIQRKLSDNDVKIYLAGAPIHSYFASSRSIVEINIIGIFSILFVCSLCFYYFKTLNILIPMLLSLLAGCIAGYCMTGIFLENIHILTFVFSTTLIGISADYSLHYFVSKTPDKIPEETINSIIKSLTCGMLTTCSAFLILLFSKTLLLKQIALFTISGLLGVYLFVILFYPILCAKINSHSKKIPQINFKGKKILISGIIILSVIGLWRLNYNDNIKSMYVPSKELVNAEKIFSEVSQTKSKTSFIIVEGKDLEDCLEKEEKISDILNLTEYQAMSRYIPSVQKQKQNKNLIERLYSTEKTDYVTSPQKYPQTPDLVFSEENFPFLNNFIYEKNKTIMLLYDFDSPELIEGIEGVKYFDIQKDVSNIVKTCRQNCSRLFIPVFALLFVILAIIFGVKNSIKIMLPSMFASLFVIGLTGILGIDINLFHILAVFLLIGFGLDYSIFRFNGSKQVNDAVFMSCITSVFSFMLLSLTGFKLISSIGFVLSIGLLTSYILSIFLISKD